MGNRRLVIIGVTGSIGRQTLDVVERLKDSEYALDIVGMSAMKSPDFPELAWRYQPQGLSFSKPFDLPDGCRHYANDKEMLEALEPDVVMVASSGGETLQTTVAALKTSRRACLANKESLVLGGRFVMEMAKVDYADPVSGRSTSRLIPVDSEHSGIFQLLMGEHKDQIGQLTLTASGGALRDWKLEDLEKAKLSDVLAHPIWKMGPKITVDSATMFNKGLEMIEAAHLFSVEEAQIKVLICPTSYVHAMVQFRDGTVKMHAGPADMRIPIAFSLTCPGRASLDWEHPKEIKPAPIPLEAVDHARYPAINLARYVLSSSISRAVQYNAFNELAAQAFIEGRITFPEIYQSVDRAMQREQEIHLDSIEDIIEYHRRLKQRDLLSVLQPGR